MIGRGDTATELRLTIGTRMAWAAAAARSAHHALHTTARSSTSRSRRPRPPPSTRSARHQTAGLGRGAATQNRARVRTGNSRRSETKPASETPLIDRPRLATTMLTLGIAPFRTATMPSPDSSGLALPQVDFPTSTIPADASPPRARPETDPLGRDDLRAHASLERSPGIAHDRPHHRDDPRDELRSDAQTRHHALHVRLSATSDGRRARKCRPGSQTTARANCCPTRIAPTQTSSSATGSTRRTRPTH